MEKPTKKRKLTDEQKEMARERKRRYRQNSSEAFKQKERDRNRAYRNNYSEENRHQQTERRKAKRSAGTMARGSEILPTETYLGQQNDKCRHCGANHFTKERTTEGHFSSCCGNGTIQLKHLSDYPTQLQSWLTDHSEDGKNFKANIRKYNSAFAFASFGYQPVKLNTGPSVFVIHGQVYHRSVTNLTSSNMENEVDTRKYAQLYMLDPEFAADERAKNKHNQLCKQSIILKLEAILREINPFAQAFKMMKEILDTTPDQNTVEMWITKDRQHDPRRYNLPLATEVAAVFVSENGEPPFARDIAIHPRGSNYLQNIQIFSPNCDPMIYPILFPHGNSGWQPGISKTSTAKKHPKGNVSYVLSY